MSSTQEMRRAEALNLAVLRRRRERRESAVRLAGRARSAVAVPR